MSGFICLCPSLSFPSRLGMPPAKVRRLADADRREREAEASLMIQAELETPRVSLSTPRDQDDHSNPALHRSSAKGVTARSTADESGDVGAHERVRDDVGGERAPRSSVREQDDSRPADSDGGVGGGVDAASEAISEQGIGAVASELRKDQTPSAGSDRKADSATKAAARVVATEPAAASDPQRDTASEPSEAPAVGRIDGSAADETSVSLPEKKLERKSNGVARVSTTAPPAVFRPVPAPTESTLTLGRSGRQNSNPGSGGGRFIQRDVEAARLMICARKLDLAAREWVGVRCLLLRRATCASAPRKATPLGVGAGRGNGVCGSSVKNDELVSENGSLTREDGRDNSAVGPANGRSGDVVSGQAAAVDGKGAMIGHSTLVLQAALPSSERKSGLGEQNSAVETELDRALQALSSEGTELTLESAGDVTDIGIGGVAWGGWDCEGKEKVGYVSLSSTRSCLHPFWIANGPFFHPNMVPFLLARDFLLLFRSEQNVLVSGSIVLIKH